MSTYQALFVARGNDVTYKLALTGPNGPVNLTGLALTFYIKASATADDATATTFTVGAGITVTDAVNGKVSVAVPKTANTPAGTYWWRIDITSAPVTTVMEGSYYVQAV